MKINKDTDVLLVVDVQDDFVTGSLAVPGAEEIIPVINGVQPKFLVVAYSRDAHIPGHPSFKAQGGPWPEHCVINSDGYRFATGLRVCTNRYPAIIDKGREVEAHSAFSGVIVAGSGYRCLKDLLGFRSIKRLFICGLATDYCVKATVLDALKLFDGEVYVIPDAVRAVNVKKGDGDKALKGMVDAGAVLITSNDLED